MGEPGAPERREFMMPVQAADAAKQFEIEAMRLIASNLAKLGEKFDEQAKTVNDIHTRVVKIESNRLESEVGTLAARVELLAGKVEALKSDKDRRDGAMNFANWFVANWTSLVAMIAACAIAAKLYLFGK